MEAAVEIAAVIRRATDPRTKVYCSVDVPPVAKERGGRGGGSGESVEHSGLEEQLASLQDLQQQQQYEREAVLSKINTARKFLLQKLMDYKGADWK